MGNSSSRKTSQRKSRKTRKINIKLVSTTKAAELMGVDRTTVFRWIKKGYVRAYKVGNRYVIPISDLRLIKELRKQGLPLSLAKRFRKVKE